MYILWPEQLAYIEMDGVKRVKCWPLGLAPTKIIERNAYLPKEMLPSQFSWKKSHFEEMPEHEIIFAAKAKSNKMRNRDSILSRAEVGRAAAAASKPTHNDRLPTTSQTTTTVRERCDAFFPQKLQESRDYYLTFVILGKFRTFSYHCLQKSYKDS